MIDTDKYEGHQLSEFKTSVAGPNHSWVTYTHSHGYREALFVKHATAALVLDAPLLLEEVKRLRELIKNINGWVMCEDTDEIKLNCIRNQLECPSLKEMIE
tara:strand:- start:317 stop:619 length:303 start_codon:yes stop_codon:yes gene_type:complete